MSRDKWSDTAGDWMERAILAEAERDRLSVALAEEKAALKSAAQANVDERAIYTAEIARLSAALTDKDQLMTTAIEQAAQALRLVIESTQMHPQVRAEVDAALARLTDHEQLIRRSVRERSAPAEETSKDTDENAKLREKLEDDALLKVVAERDAAKQGRQLVLETMQAENDALRTRITELEAAMLTEREACASLIYSFADKLIAAIRARPVS